MLNVLTRPGVFKASLAVSLYWLALFLLSVIDVDVFPPKWLVLPAMVLAGVPLLMFAASTIWRSAHGRLDELAFLDELTGLGNRRSFMRNGALVSRVTKPGAASLILLDVDGLKTINDDCGHQAGDELLQQVAAHIGVEGRATYRIGGDEFAIIVDRSRGESVTSVMRELTPVPHQFQVCGHEHVIQFSYGFASRRDQETFEQLFSRADARLRQFKHRLYSSGRKQERRITNNLASAELDRVLAEVAEDDAHDDSGVVSIFAHKKSQKRSDDSRTSSGR